MRLNRFWILGTILSIALPFAAWADELRLQVEFEAPELNLDRPQGWEDVYSYRLGAEWQWRPETAIRFGGYLQDKIEFEGMIANVGIRLDYNHPNVDWFTADPYSPYFSRVFKDLLVDEAPTEAAKLP